MADGVSRTFAEILDELCRNPAGRRRRRTNVGLAQAVQALGGDITDGYISLLRKGRRDNPTLQTLEYLAAALDVCPAVFVGGRRARSGEEWPRRSFSVKLRHLFAAVHPPGRGPYTPEEAAAAISRLGTWGTISSSYVRELLQPPAGSLPNPRLKHIQGLADHFGLADDSGPQAAYFMDDDLAAEVDAELADFVALRDAGVVEFAARIAAHAAAWSPHRRRQAVETITHALESGGNSWWFPQSSG